MKTEEQEWAEYARELRRVAGARADAQQEQDRRTAAKTQAEATAMAEANAMAERGHKLEVRLNGLAEKAAVSLQRAGLPSDGKRTPVPLPEIRAIADIEVVASRITKQLAETVDQLEAVRAEALAEQERRKRRTISAALTVAALLIVWVAQSFFAGVEAAAIAAVTMLAASRVLGLPRLPGARWWGWGGAVLVVVLMAAGLPWWLAIGVPVLVSGTAIVLPKKRNS
ncbi:hypothetical protein [Kribbella italica]|uniref:Uncharacterized protein n=1 Tax=Kribbella italica TaxID=1540520 RepID=A0A7W9J636_9ACTN|nr:hypothetical protein [Kribbella italica]MBB5836284.1 hypothetical protein [Kribbella italica]